MAALRVNPPGQPIRYIDLGPARGRISVNAFTSAGGPIEARVIRREAPARSFDVPLPPKPVLRCGKPIPKTGAVCGRPIHNDLQPHRSVESVAKNNARRRTSR